jgi:hypothetical protein
METILLFYFSHSSTGERQKLVRSSLLLLAAMASASPVAARELLANFDFSCVAKLPLERKGVSGTASQRNATQSNATSSQFTTQENLPM